MVFTSVILFSTQLILLYSQEKGPNEMKPTIFFLINSIDIKRGGLTRASLKQASVFAEMGFNTYMLTFNFNPNYQKIIHELKEMNKVHKDVKFQNMFENFEGKIHTKLKASPLKVSLEDITKGYAYDKRKNHNAYRLYKNGVYCKYISLSEHDSIDYIDYFNENGYRTKRVTYDLWGFVKRVSYMDLLLNKPRQITYHDETNRTFLTQWNDPKTGGVKRLIFFNKDSSIKKQYVNDSITHKVDWLTDIINNENKKSIVISDTRSTDQVLINFNLPNAAKIWRLHSNHVTSPYTPDSNISTAVKPGYNNLDKFDVAIFLTNEQKKDVLKRTKQKKDNIRVIPHYHENNVNIFESFFKRSRPDQKLAVIVSRLSTLKQIEHSIKAFNKVTKAIPDARLEIWGQGPQERKLKKLINKLGLNTNVFLKGYTLQPDKIYEKGLFSILTSKSEGFALSVLESMYNKTPVISYDVQYGPTDMIIHGKNGFIVEKKDIEGLAKSMIWMFENPDKAIDMGKKARKYVDKHFNKERYKNKWLEVIDLAMKNKFS